QESMTSIIRFDNSCKIVDEDEDVLRLLDKELSFRIEGAEFSAAFQGYVNDAGEFVTWDGRRHLLTSTGKFPVGLLPRVQEFFARRNQYIDIIDQRTDKGKPTPIDISGNLNSLGMTVRPYQELAANTAVKTDRGVIRLATGGGKCESIDSLHITEDGLLDYEEMLNGVKLNDGDVIEYKKSISTSPKFGGKDETSMIYRDGYGPSRKITTSFGYTQTATPNHKIQVISQNGFVEWKKFKDLKEGDYAAISYGNMMFGKNDMPLDEAYWYGLLFGDGSLTLDHSISFTSMDTHLLDFSKNYLVKIGLKFSEYDTKSKAKDIKVYSKEYRDRLILLGLKKEKS